MEQQPLRDDSDEQDRPGCDPRLIALVRLLARQAAKEYLAMIQGEAANDNHATTRTHRTAVR
jgi:hypothetical protein